MNRYYHRSCRPQSESPYPKLHRQRDCGEAALYRNGDYARHDTKERECVKVDEQRCALA